MTPSLPTPTHPIPPARGSVMATPKVFGGLAIWLMGTLLLVVFNAPHWAWGVVFAALGAAETGPDFEGLRCRHREAVCVLFWHRVL